MFAIDVETTGLLPLSGSRVIEVAAVSINSPTFEFSSLINPGVLVPEAVFDLTGINQESLDIAAQPRSVFFDFKKIIGSKDLVAHNSSFERTFLQSEFSRFGWGFHNGMKCTLKLARQKLKKLPNYRLSTIASYLFGKEVDSYQYHRALQDARMVARVWKELGGQ